jgi:predicted nicotinamide N-methyase
MVSQGLIPPTAQLPHIAKLASSSPESLSKALQYLQLLYNSEVRGSRRVKKALSTDIYPSIGSNANLKADDRADLDLLRADSYERTYAMRWLTALISHASTFESIDCESNLMPHDLAQTHLAAQYDAILTAASSLLAICAGASAAGILTRTFTFGSDAGDISVTLTDAPLENQTFESVGAQTWGGACVLAEIIVEQPTMFGLAPEISKGKRVRLLELGAGTGLVSLTLSKLLEKTGIEAEIVATDFYLAVLANLQSNIAANRIRSASPVSLTNYFLDWSTFAALEAPLPPFDNAFDIIFGADIIYEASHALWIKSCLQVLLRRPKACCAFPPAIFHLIIPLRPTHTMECQTVEEVFPLVPTPATLPLSDMIDLELVILEKEVIVCEAGEGRRDMDVEYGYYKIGWGLI